MNVETILYPTDFSESSRQALNLAESLARANSARLLIAHIYDPMKQNMVATTTIPVDMQDEQTVKLEQVRPLDPAVRFEHRLVEGNPSDGIVELAETEGVDLIVMGTHGHTGLMRLLMGSVAEEVVRKASCAVITLKQPDQNAAAET